MKHGYLLPLPWRRLAVLLAALASLSAQADEYDAVQQLIRAGQLPQAQSRADQYLTGKPRDPQMRFLKGVIQRDAGKIDDAIATFTGLIEDYPELPEPYNNLAVIHAGRGQYDKARAALEMAVRVNPAYATAHENLGDIHLQLARQAYARALELDPAQTGAQPKLERLQPLLAAPPRQP